MGFRFEKLYADVVTADGTVCVTYLASLDAWGLRSVRAGLELYWPNGRREVIHARSPPERVDLEQPELKLSFDVPGGPFVLQYRVVHGGWTPQGEPPCDALRWSVKVAKAEAVGRWMGDPRRPVLRGLGYADWVELRRPTKSLKLGSIQWGRVHFPHATMVFNALDFRSGRSWLRAARWSDVAMTEWSAFRIERSAMGDQVDLRGLAGRLSIDPGRALHVGYPIDRARFPAALERMLSSAMTGPANERRCIGRARWGEESEAGCGWALHEAVRFGRVDAPFAVLEAGGRAAP